jgi:hypothetical protein
MTLTSAELTSATDGRSTLSDTRRNASGTRLAADDLLAVEEPSADAATPASEHDQGELTAGLSRLRRRGSLVATDRWLAFAAGGLLLIGPLFVLAGWYGAAHTTRLFEEIPYLISGGIFGLLLVIVGAACYFGYWLTHLVRSDRQMLDVLVRIEERLSQAPSAAGAAPPAGAAPRLLVATRTGSMFHRPDCQVVAERDPAELRTITLPAAGMEPCRLCAPLA